MMLPGSGRPRKACGTCKSQKIRCTGEKPSCKRCSRLKHICVYSDSPCARHPKSQRALSSARSEPSDSPTPAIIRVGSITNTAKTSGTAYDQNDSFLSSHQPASNDRYVGIPKALISTLVDLYFENVYNAHLLLHKTSFLQTVISGTARAHVVLGVCAWGANFYKDANGQATLKEHGFMLEWAHRAGKLVLQELHEFHDDSLVTFVNMGVFWHSQGNWRMAILNKGSACNLLVIIGVGPATLQQATPWDSEVRRRRYWGGYLMHCHNSESLSNFPVPGMDKLALPWPEADFEAGYSRSAPVTLDSSQGNGGIFAEVVKILTLWSSVLSCIKKTEPSLGAKLPAMYTLHERLLDWWRALPPEMCLTPTNLAATAKNLLPNILLMNVVYHQSICALHASIVPLFCWGEGDQSWSIARQLSAQLAYEHACKTSELLETVLTTFDDKLSAMPSFISYGAYCGCAIQIPFMWSSNRSVRERAYANIKANMKMINVMSENWKFAALLKIYVRCLYHGHKKNPTIMEDEPKNVDPIKLTSFQMNAPHVQASILEFIGILYSKEEGYAKPGKTLGLEIENGDLEEEPPSRMSPSEDRQAASSDSHIASQHASKTSWPQPSYPPVPCTPESLVQYQHDQAQQQRQPAHTIPSVLPNTYHTADILPESQTLDIFQPLLDPEMLDLFPNGEIPDLSAFDTSSLNLDHFELEGWGDVAVAVASGDTGSWAGSANVR